MLGVEVEVSSSLGQELGDLTVCVDWVAVIAIPSQTVSLVRILEGEVGDIDVLVVLVAAATVSVTEATWILRGETGVLGVLGCQPTPVGDVSG